MLHAPVHHLREFIIFSGYSYFNVLDRPNFDYLDSSSPGICPMSHRGCLTLKYLNNLVHVHHTNALLSGTIRLGIARPCQATGLIGGQLRPCQQMTLFEWLHSYPTALILSPLFQTPDSALWKRLIRVSRSSDFVNSRLPRMSHEVD